jgi:hypothetical protein
LSAFFISTATFIYPDSGVLNGNRRRNLINSQFSVPIRAAPRKSDGSSDEIWELRIDQILGPSSHSRGLHRFVTF